MSETTTGASGASYAAAGVDIEAGDRAVELMKEWVKKTRRPEVLGGLGGFAGAGVHVHIMQATGLLMMALFLHLYFAPWRRLRRALAAGDHQAAAVQLDQIRRIVAINLVLGIITVLVGSTGRFWQAM